jgi:hypothetical protein
MTTAETTSLDRYVELKAEKARIERDLRIVKDELAPLEAALLEEFATEGVSGKRHAGTGKLVSIARRVWARAADGDKDAAADALEAAGLGDYVQRGFNTNSLSAHFRELVKARQEAGDPVTDLDALLPEPLRGRIELTEDAVLSVRS